MDHSATAQRLYELLNAGDIDGFGALLADDFVENEELDTPPTREGVQTFFRVMRAAFPDMRMTVDDLLPSGDKVVVRGHFTGTNEGEFMGMPATGRAVSVPLIDILRFEDDGLAHEHWGVFDRMAMMQQLGALGGARLVTGDGQPLDAAGGVVRLWLPAGATLADADGVAWWSPDPGMGAFQVVSGDAADGGGDELLAAEREGAEVEVERDERSERGGLAVRRLRYRTRRATPRVVRSGAAGRVHTGGESERRLADLLLVTAGGTLVRVGYTVRDDAPTAMRDDFAEALERVRLGTER